MDKWQEYIKTVENQVAEEVRKQYPNLNFYVVIDQDPRYPLVVFNDNPDNPEWDDYKGYTWSMENNRLGHNVCTCHAFEPDECSCGAWDSVDRDEWYAEEYD